MTIQISDVADLPFHFRTQLDVTLLHPGDDALANVDIDDRLDAPIVDVGRKAGITAPDIEN